jgi:hypothetical protein
LRRIWNALTFVGALTLAGCAWRGSPKIDTGADYSTCMKSCDPGGACIPKGKGWECLPPAVPVVDPKTQGAK